MKLKRQPWMLALPATLLLLFFFMAPLVFAFVKNLFEAGLVNYIKFFSDGFYRGILITTILVALKVTLFSLLLGYPAAYYIARTRSRIRNLLLIATIFPFLVSALVRAYGWMVILGDSGLLNQVLIALHVTHQPLKILYTVNGVIIGLVHLLTPYMILSIASVLQNIDGNLEMASQSLGANRWQTFTRILFPLSLPGVITGCILVFTLSMTSFVTPKLLGGSTVKLMSTMVYQEVQVTFNWPMASAISFIMLFTIIAILLISNLLTKTTMSKLEGAGESA